MGVVVTLGREARIDGIERMRPVRDEIADHVADLLDRMPNPVVLTHRLDIDHRYEDLETSCRRGLGDMTDIADQG